MKFIVTRNRAYWVKEKMVIEADNREDAENEFYDAFDPELEVGDLCKFGGQVMEEPLVFECDAESEPQCETKCWQITWFQCPRVYHPLQCFRVEAANEEDAKIVAEDHIRDHYACGWFSIEKVEEYTKPTCGKVVVP